MPVSVIIPCYRCVDTIVRAVESVMSQTLLPSEIFLVDDASDDGGRTREGLESLCAQHGTGVRFVLIALDSNSGPGAARNAAWDRAEQDYLAFLDADDAWHPRKLEIQYGWMAEHPAVTLTGHPMALKDPAALSPGDGGIAAGHIKARQVTPQQLLWSNCFQTPTVMIRRNIPYRFDKAKRFSEDYLLWLQIAWDANETWRLELPLASLFKAPFGEAGLSGNLWKMEKGELENYLRLYRQGRIGVILLCAASLCSLMKLGRRWLITAINVGRGAGRSTL